MNDFEATLSVLRKCTRVGDCLEAKTYNRQKYPYLRFRGKHEKGNRLLLRIWSQTDGVGVLALHTCDNVKCINPAHLYWGNMSRNALDSVERNRHFNSIKTICKNGHSLSGDNVRVQSSGNRIGRRYCRTCERARKVQMLKKCNTQRSAGGGE